MHFESLYRSGSEDSVAPTGQCEEPPTSAPIGSGAATERPGAAPDSGAPRGGVHDLPDCLRPLAGLGARLPYCPRRDLRALYAEIQLHTVRCMKHGF